MGKSKKAPGYANTNYDTGGLFGSSTTNEAGTKFTPENWMKSANTTAASGINTSLGNMLANDYANDPNFQVYQNQMNKAMEQNYDATVLSNLANRGLMRSSGLQSATNSFANTLADRTAELYDSYYNRQANNLANSLNTQNALYQYITGINQGSQTGSKNVSDYNMNAWQAEQQAKQAMWGNLMNAGASLAGAGITGGASLAGNKMLANALTASALKQ